MAVREILLLGNPRLWEPAEPVLDVRAREIQEAIADLGATLADFRARRGFGRAIAAPQIGVSRRIVFVNLGQPLPLINPAVVGTGGGEMELWDDCFSFPDLMVRVRRQVQVTVRYQDEEGATHLLTAANDLSELLQHEIDHLDGILATDRAIDARSFALRSEVERSRR